MGAKSRNIEIYVSHERYRRLLLTLGLILIFLALPAAVYIAFALRKPAPLPNQRTRPASCCAAPSKDVRTI